MRYIVYGAGAVGDVVGGRLFEHGLDVLLIARGDHLAAIRRSGLTIESPLGSVTLPVPAAEHPSEISLLGRLHGVPTPVNAVLQDLAARCAREHRPPGSIPVDDILRLYERAADVKAGEPSA